MEFANKIALVTGTTGIGKAIAKRFARAGAQVLSCGIDPDANQMLINEANNENVTIEVRKCDVSAWSEVKAAVKAAVSRFGAVDVIVNAAAVHPMERQPKLTDLLQTKFD